jgi:hypothetical protein
LKKPGKADEEENKLLFGIKKHYSADMTYEKFVNAYEGKHLYCTSIKVQQLLRILRQMRIGLVLNSSVFYT